MERVRGRKASDQLGAMNKFEKPTESERRDDPSRKEKAGEIKIPERKKKQDDTSAYKTEDQLKAEALERKRIEHLMAANQKPKGKVEKKAENFWYHYRGAFIATIIGVVMVAFFVKDVIFKTKPDLTIVMVTDKYLSNDYLDQLTSAVEAKTPDLNGDGKIYVSMDHIPHIPYSDGQDESEYMQEQNYNYIMKLMTVIAATDDPIYLLDRENFEYLNAMGEDSDEPYAMFETLEDIPRAVGYALPLEETSIESGEIPTFFDNLSFYFRSVRETRKNRDYIAGCMQFLEEIAID